MGCTDCRGVNYAIFAKWSEHVCVLLRVFWGQYLAVACARKSARPRDELKAPWGSRVRKVIGFTCPATVVSVTEKHLWMWKKNVCKFLSFSVLGELTESRQHHCLIKCSVSLALLENWDPTTAFWEWTGNPIHPPLLSPPTLYCVIQLWNDRIMVRCAHFKVLAHILGSFHYSLHNPHNVCVIYYFLSEYKVWTLFCLKGLPPLHWSEALAAAAKLADTNFWVLWGCEYWPNRHKTNTTGCQMLNILKCLMYCWQFIKLCSFLPHPATFSTHQSKCYAVQHTSNTYPHSWMADLFTSCLSALSNQKMRKKRVKNG